MRIVKGQSVAVVKRIQFLDEVCEVAQLAKYRGCGRCAIQP
jgi:hypothetical protein